LMAGCVTLASAMITGLVRTADVRLIRTIMATRASR
jgi:hypothetical protein